MDPFTCIAAASTAYNSIKKGFELGREISSMGGQLQQWSKAMSDLDYAHEKASKPPMYKMFSDTQSQALEAWSCKQQAKEMREELRSYISFVHGPSAWDEIVRTEAKMRKEQREQVYKRQEFIDSLINGVLIALFLLAGVGGLITLLYFIGVQQDKW
jgi:hypothetical protein|tara:strand:+ start:309 stop:779 length:471 start_codon:yes stop_codon:yes gene_type:complete